MEGDVENIELSMQDPETMQWQAHHMSPDAPKFVVFYKE